MAISQLLNNSCCFGGIFTYCCDPLNRYVDMAALAANAVKSQRRKAAKALADQAMSQVNEQKQFLNSVAQKHRDSLSSISTLGSNKPEVKIT